MLINLEYQEIHNSQLRINRADLDKFLNTKNHSAILDYLGTKGIPWEYCLSGKFYQIYSPINYILQAFHEFRTFQIVAGVNVA